MKTEVNTAALANPALKPFAPLIGEWNTTGTHPQLPGVTLHGRTSFQWMEGGAFLLMHSGNEEGKIPASVAIFGSDETKGEYFMLYFDDRKVSRKCEVEINGNVLKWSRVAPEFSQRYTFTFADDNNTIISSGEMLTPGSTWEPDLELTYNRII